jgi:predicted phage terminase large subunit-like protein
MNTQPSVPALFDIVLRSDFESFVQKAFSVVHPDRKVAWSWHIRAICWHLYLVRSGQMPRLIINLPPRSLKSFIVSVAWPAFLLGLDPSLRIVCVSYTDDLARDHARLFRILIESQIYRRLFPKMRISPRKNTEGMVATTRGGFRLATSIGGTLTGKGGDLIIIDDPMKAEDVNSKVERERVIDWYKSTLASRLNDAVNGQIVVVMQRIHSFDLSGYLLEQDDWTSLALPAEARRDFDVAIGRNRWHRYSEGDLLHGARLPGAILEARCRELGSAQYSAQYLQDPVPPDGTIIKRAWFRYYEPRIQPVVIEIIQSWDVAAKIAEGNDYSVCVTVGIARDGYYIMDVKRFKAEFPVLQRTAEAMAEQYRPNRILIEDSSNGTALLQNLTFGTRLNVIGIKPKQDKEARANGVAAAFEAGRVKFKKDAEWLLEFERELLEFPNSRHDDQVDALTQGLIWAQENTERLPGLIPAILMPRDEADLFIRDADCDGVDDDEDHLVSLPPALVRWHY